MGVMFSKSGAPYYRGKDAHALLPKSAMMAATTPPPAYDAEADGQYKLLKQVLELALTQKRDPVELGAAIALCPLIVQVLGADRLLTHQMLPVAIAAVSWFEMYRSRTWWSGSTMSFGTSTRSRRR